jgi:hypothetical protein
MLPDHPRPKNRLMGMRPLQGGSKIRPHLANYPRKQNGMNKIYSFRSLVVFCPGSDSVEIHIESSLFILLYFLRVQSSANSAVRLHDSL